MCEPAVPCATRCFRCGAIWRPDPKLDRARRQRHLRPQPRLSPSPSAAANLAGNRSGRILPSRSPGLSPRLSRPQRRPRVSRYGLPSRSELKLPPPHRRRRHRERLDRRRLHVRPTLSLVRRPPLPRVRRGVPRLLHPRLQRLPFDRRRHRPRQAPFRLRPRQARSLPLVRLRRRRRPDLQGRPGSVPRTPSSLRIQRSRQSDWPERSSLIWSCTIRANARKGFATAT